MDGFYWSETLHGSVICTRRGYSNGDAESDGDICMPAPPADDVFGGLRRPVQRAQIRSAAALRDALFGGRNVFRAVSVDSRTVNGMRVRPPTFGKDPWTLTVPTIERMLQTIGGTCRSLIEVGSWTGTSTVNLARALRRYNGEPDPIGVVPGLPAASGAGGGPVVVAVDTWLGSAEFFNPSYGHRDTNYTSFWETAGFVNDVGYPTAYAQFLLNVASAGLDENVVAFPQASLVAAKILFGKGLLADAIYIDASHEYADVRADLRAWWEVLRVGGVLFGDDYNWHGVKRAVDEFAAARGLRLALQPAVRAWGVPVAPGELGKTEWILTPKRC